MAKLCWPWGRLLALLNVCVPSYKYTYMQNTFHHHIQVCPIQQTLNQIRLYKHSSLSRVIRGRVQTYMELQKREFFSDCKLLALYVHLRTYMSCGDCICVFILVLSSYKKHLCYHVLLPDALQAIVIADAGYLFNQLMVIMDQFALE